MDEQTSGPVAPPVTGNHVIDRALAGVADPGDAPLAEQQQRLAAVQDALGGVLDSSRSGASAVPDGLRPRTEGSDRG